ncbi:hypothetical protein DFH11DRAFT_1543820 [Phellopilus nigrolimitatus]|nr:hypothetical protein DFH11DRAFT_1543820 [Phellopilus nigrolimitatus]
MSGRPSITFYETTSLLEERSISPFAVRIRLLLNYKRIPYQIVRIEYPEIEAVSKSVGAPPTGKKVDGRPHYTIPFIVVAPPAPASTFALSDSPTIAAFLEETFPDPDPQHPPAIASAETRVFQSVFRQYLRDVFMAVFPVMIHAFASKLTTPEWFITTRKELFGVSAEQIAPRVGDAEGESAAWTAFENSFDGLAAHLDVLGAGNYRLVKSQVTYSEMEMVSLVFCIKRVTPDTAWKKLEGRNGGRWPKLLALYDEYLPKPVE